jgi:hypothetical protein
MVGLAFKFRVWKLSETDIVGQADLVLDLAEQCKKEELQYLVDKKVYRTINGITENSYRYPCNAFAYRLEEYLTRDRNPSLLTIQTLEHLLSYVCNNGLKHSLAIEFIEAKNEKLLDTLLAHPKTVSIEQKNRLLEFCLFYKEYADNAKKLIAAGAQLEPALKKVEEWEQAAMQKEAAEIERWRLKMLPAREYAKKTGLTPPC